MKSILVVEDDEALVHVLVRQLQRAGYDATGVTSTMAALRILDADSGIDLVLADLVMPKGEPNGLALGRMARMRRSGIKLVFITGYDLGIDGASLPGRLFRKPLDFPELLSEVGTLLSD
jgi:CheY-like chemotaxis protein